MRRRGPTGPTPAWTWARTPSCSSSKSSSACRSCRPQHRRQRGGRTSTTKFPNTRRSSSAAARYTVCPLRLARARYDLTSRAQQPFRGRTRRTSTGRRSAWPRCRPASTRSSSSSRTKLCTSSVRRRARFPLPSSPCSFAAGTAQYPGRVGNSRQGEKRAAAETEAALAELQDREAGLRDEENFGLRRAPRQPPAPHLLEGAQLDERRRAWSARYAGSPFAPTAEDTDDSSEPEPRFRPYASSAPPADGQGAFQQHDRDFETRDRQQLDPQRRGAFPPRPAGSQSPRGNSYPQGYRPTTGERPQRQGAFQQRDGDFGARDRQQFDPQRRGAFPPTPARSPSPRGNPYPQGYRPTNGGGAFGPRSQLHTLALGRRLFGTTAGLEARNRGARRAHPRFNDDDITSLEEDDDPASYELVPGDAFGTGVPMDPGLDEELWEYYYVRLASSACLCDFPTRLSVE